MRFDRALIIENFSILLINFKKGKKAFEL